MVTALWILAIVLVLAGILGTFLPGLPGPPFVFAGLFAAAWADGFARVGWVPLGVLGGLTILSLVVDLGATALGARKMGASGAAVAGACLGVLVGIFTGFVGLVVAPFLGAVLGEYLSRGDLARAGKVGAATWISLAVGAAIRVGLVFTMLGVFAAAWIL